MSGDRQTLHRILLAEDKCIGESSNVLTFLWRQILQSALPPGDAITRWESLMRSYVHRIQDTEAIPTDVVPKNPSSVKGNLRKELLSPHMTWLNFVKGMYFLNLHGVYLRVVCYWRDGSSSNHTMTVYENGTSLGLARSHLKDILRDLWMSVFTYALEGDGDVARPSVTLWRTLVEQYLNDPRNGVGRSPKYRASVKGNLSKELLMTLHRKVGSDEWIHDNEHFLTWMSFEKGINLLNPQKTEFVLTCNWRPKNASHFTAFIRGSRMGVDPTNALEAHQSP